MKKNILFILIGLLTVVSCNQDRQAATLQENQWEPVVRKALNGLLASQEKGTYAVFDFDQTSIVHDISQALWVYQIEHLRYADALSHLEDRADRRQYGLGSLTADLHHMLCRGYTTSDFARKHHLNDQQMSRLLTILREEATPHRQAA